MPFTTAHKIRFDDVDGAGIVYYPHYFHLCHATFEDFFDAHGPISYPELISGRRQGFPTVAIQSDFKAPLRYGDTAVVTLTLERLGRSSMAMRYRIHRQRDNVLCFEATITTVLIDLDTHRSLEIPPELRDALAAL